MTPIEARFEIERQLCEMAAANGGHMPLIRDLRFFPSSDHRHVLACVELMDGCELQVNYELPCDPGESFDEADARDRFLFMPSGALH